MKKFGVIHYSHNWVYGPAISRFDTLPEAEKYLKDFRGNRYHKEDQAEIIEIVSKHKSEAIDQTEDDVLYGLKEEK